MDKFIFRSPEHVNLEFIFASPGRRGLAGLLDALFTIGLMIFAILPIVFLQLPYTPLFVFLSILGIGYGYYIFFEVYNHGQTLGKKAIGICVIGEDGHSPTWRQSLIRIFFMLIDGTCFFSIGMISIVCTKNRQRLGDIVAGTYVVVWEKQSLPTSGIAWLNQLEERGTEDALRLAKGSISPKTLLLIERFLQRRESLTPEKRKLIATNLVVRIAKVAGWQKDALANQSPEHLLEGVMNQLIGNEVLEAKKDLWNKIEKEFESARHRIKKLPTAHIHSVIQNYHYCIALLSRTRALAGDEQTHDYLNRLSILGYQALYPRKLKQGKTALEVFWAFSHLVRRYRGAAALSALFFFAPALIAFFAVQHSPEIGFDLVPELFYDFKPHAEHLHEIPELTRPLAAGTIIANNIQVAIVGFSLGITAGIGTLSVLIFNGLHIGSVAGWMHLQGNAYSFWGWVMPHGVTEILAIIIACAGGLLIADAIWKPKEQSRMKSIRNASKDAFMLLLGVMGMLGIAGVIEGFISPSSLEYPGRIAFVLFSTFFWLFYFTWPDLKRLFVQPFQG